MSEEQKTVDESWEKVNELNTEVVKWTTKDDVVEGMLVRVDINVGVNNSTIYEIKDAEGIKTVWGSQVLDGKMRRVEIGQEVKIIYLGKKQSEKNKSRSYHDFEVYVRKG